MATKKANRIVTLGEVIASSVNDVIRFIYEANNEDTNKTIASRSPIKLIINSDGGDVYSGFGLVEAINNSETPVYTICHGQIQSMGLLIFSAGYKRFIGVYSTAMYHEINWEVDYQPGKHHQQELNEAERCQKIYDNILIKNTSLPRKQLDDIKTKRSYWYMTAEEVIKYKIADNLLTDSLAM